MSVTTIPHIATKTRCILIGGFLGAGKTTCVARLAEYLVDKGLRVRLVTNDEGTRLVDSIYLRSRGFVTDEITGGNLSHRFDSLLAAARRGNESDHPDVLVAEPAGNSLGLRHGVTDPLKRDHEHEFATAPLSVLVDPILADRIFRVNEPSGAPISEQVVQLYRQQLDEADTVVINKSDLLSGRELQALEAKLRHEYPKAELRIVSARTGANLEDWFDHLFGENQASSPERTPGIGSSVTSENIGWLNCTVKLSSPRVFAANELMIEIARTLQELFRERGAEIMHLKMSLAPEDGLAELAMIHFVQSGLAPELTDGLSEPIDRAELTLNLRADASPDLLHNIVTQTLSAVSDKNLNLLARLEHIEHFRPGSRGSSRVAQ